VTVSGETVLWTLTKNGRRAEAVMVPLDDLGAELQYRLDGEWYYTHMYRDGEGAKLLEDAKAKREELEGKGWTPADTGAP
jgi:hypothetical protein